MPQNRQHHRKAKYPDKVAKPKSLVFVRIFLFRSAGSKITYFPTAPFFKLKKPPCGGLNYFVPNILSPASPSPGQI